jgi:CoA-binding domain
MIGQEGVAAARVLEAPVWSRRGTGVPPSRAAATRALRRLEGPLASTPRLLRPRQLAPAPGMSPRVFAGLVRIGEFVLLAALGFFIAYGYVAEFLRQYAAALALTSAVAVVLFQALGLYRIAGLASLDRQLPRLLSAWTATLALLLCAIFFVKAGATFSRAWLALWYLAGSVGLIAFRGGVGPRSAAARCAPADEPAGRRSMAPANPAKGFCRRWRRMPTAI